MQVFVLNVRGKTLIIDVNRWESIWDVKNKIQKRCGVDPNFQRLYFCGKLLDNKNVLTHYNIRNESNLHFNVSLWSYNSDLETSETSDTLSLVNRPQVNWSGLAAVAKAEIEVEIKQRKDTYDKILERKIGLKKKTMDLNVEINIDTFEAESVEVKIQEGLKEVGNLNEEINRLHEEIRKKHEQKSQFKRKNENLVARKGLIFVRIAEKRSILDKYYHDMKKMDLDMEATFVSDKDKLLKEFEGVHNINVDLGKVIRDMIAKKKALLECPVCYEISAPPIYKCPREHLVCSNCIPKVNKCPSCRIPILQNNDNRFRSAEENWEELQELMDKL